MSNDEGPRSETVEHFWMMVWEHRIKTIVMLTRCVEMSKAGRPNTQSLYNNTPKLVKKSVINIYAVIAGEMCSVLA